MRMQVRGFWLDIRVGPFVPFGVDCDKPNQAAKDLFLVHNKVSDERHNSLTHTRYMCAYSGMVILNVRRFNRRLQA
jgi:Domain of unknown function (DUF4471)